MSGWRIHCRSGRRWLSVLALLLPLASPGGAAETNPAAAPVIFRVGMAKVCFLDVNRNDATAAYKVFLENQGRRMGKIYQADPRIYDDTPSFEAAIQHQPMHLAIMDPWQFLTMDIHQQMKPVFAVMVNGQVGRRYVVLTRRDSGFSSLRSLRGQTLLQISAASATVGTIWLDTQLLSEGLETHEKFFEHVQVVAKPTAAILPVFFGKQSACVVDEASFDVMNELNPQVGQQLQRVATSDTFTDVVICLREEGWSSPTDKLDTIQSMRDMHRDPVGQQICTLFKVDRMVPFADAQLDTLRKLRATLWGPAKGRIPTAPVPPHPVPTWK